MKVIGTKARSAKRLRNYWRYIVKRHVKEIPQILAKLISN